MLKIGIDMFRENKDQPYPLSFFPALYQDITNSDEAGVLWPHGNEDWLGIPEKTPLAQTKNQRK